VSNWCEAAHFLGDLLTVGGIRPGKRKVSAINNMPRPESKEDIQRFLGMVNYLAKWIPDLSQKSAPLKQFLDHRSVWLWDDPQEISWRELKDILISGPVLQYF
jgi:hypothetical protein